MKNARDIIKFFEAQPGESWLPAVLIMIDLEMSGVIPERDDVLQIAMLRLELKNNRYEVRGEPLEIFVGSDKTPSNAFQREFLVDIMAKANASTVDAEQAKALIIGWLGDLKGLVVPTGDAIQCDLAFLYEKGIIERGDIVNDQSVPGTFNHEAFDLNPLKCVARQKIGSRETLELEDGHHNAMVDCRNQTKELNAYLEILL